MINALSGLSLVYDVELLPFLAQINSLAPLIIHVKSQIATSNGECSAAFL